jgi:CheY-like chemotaxis protein
VAERTAEAHARAAELQELAAELSRAEERERLRIAAMLHEGLQQDLVALRYRVDALAHGKADEGFLQEFGAAIDDCVVRTRELSYDLSPPAAKAGFLPVLEWLSGDVSRRFGLNVTVKAGPHVEPVNPTLAAVLFRSVKELLLNVRKHSGASSAEITVMRTADRIQVSVADRGRGFDAAGVIAGRTGARGFGFHSIEERLHFLGGDIDIGSQAGEGCRVTLSVPDSGDSGATVGVLPAGLEAAFETAAFPGRVGPRATPVSPAVIRVLLADDHALTRQGLATLLDREKDIEVVAQAADGEEAVHLVLELRPDVVLMDVSMPRMDGFEATRRITQRLPEIRIIGLSMYDDPGIAEKMRQNGAAGYLCKTGSLDALINAVRGGDGRVH